MQRRDISKALLAAATATGANAVAQTTKAQSGSAPYYAQTAEESAVTVTVANYAYPPGDVRRYGADPSGKTDSTKTIQSAIDQHIRGGPAVLVHPGTYNISASLNLGDAGHSYAGLQFLGIGLPTINSTNRAAPIIKAGGERIEIANLKLQYGTLPSSSQSDAIGVRAYNLYESKLDRLYFSNVHGAIDQYQGLVNGSQSAFYSNRVSNIRIVRFSGWAISLVPYRGGNSGNRLDNIYINNVVDGKPSHNLACMGGVRMSVGDDGVIDQLNIEWCKNSGSLLSLTAAGNVTFNGLHFEGNYPVTAFQPIIDIVGGRGIGSAPTFSGVTVAGNDWTGYGGEKRGLLFRIDNQGSRTIVRGIDCRGNTAAANMTACGQSGSSGFGSIIEFESVCDMDGSLSSDAYTAKASFGSISSGVEYPLQRWNQNVAKHCTMVTDNAGGTAAASFLMTGTNPNGTVNDMMGLWDSANSRFVPKQPGIYLATVTIPAGISPVIQVKKNGAIVASIRPAPGFGGCANLACARGDTIQFVLASGNYTRSGVMFGISLA